MRALALVSSEHSAVFLIHSFYDLSMTTEINTSAILVIVKCHEGGLFHKPGMQRETIVI